MLNFSFYFYFSTCSLLFRKAPREQNAAAQFCESPRARSYFHRTLLYIRDKDICVLTRLKFARDDGKGKLFRFYQKIREIDRLSFGKKARGARIRFVGRLDMFICHNASREWSKIPRPLDSLTSI